ncbi:glycosyltransferase family 9 protein, partial [Thermodesulfobacteriota bacterium]
MNNLNINMRQTHSEDYRIAPFRWLKFKAGYGLYLSMRLLGRLMPDRNKPGNILLINLNGIGDVIVSTSVLAGIRDKFPEKSIAYVTHAGAAPVLDGNPFIDRVYIHRGNRPDLLMQFLAFCREFRPEYTLALNPGYKNSLLVAMAPGTKKIWFLREDRMVVRLGNSIYLESVSAGNLAEYASIVAGKIGCKGTGFPLIPITAGNRVPVFFNGSRPIALFVGGKWQWKRWDSGKFAELAAKLSADHPLIVCGGKGDGHRDDGWDNA